MKVLWCVVLLTFGAVVIAQQEYSDYWSTDYDNFYENYDETNGDSIENSELKQVEPAETSKTTDAVAEIQDVQHTESNKEFDALQDYQIEDNRSVSVEKGEVEDKLPDEEPMPDDAPENYDNEKLSVLPLEKDKETVVSEQSTVIDEDKQTDLIDNVKPLPVPTGDGENNLETPQDDHKEQEIKEEIQPSTSEKNFDEFEDIDKILEETNKLLEESDDSFEANDYDNSDEQELNNSDEDLFSENNDDFNEDTPEKVYADLNADLDKLFETLDKLTADSSDEDKEIEEDGTDDENVQDYEDKYGKPYNEDVAMSWRNEEADAAPPTDSKQSDEIETQKTNDESILEDEDSDDYENIDDSNLSEIFANNVSALDTSSKSSENNKQELLEADSDDKKTAEESKESDDKKEATTPGEEKDEALDYAYYDDKLDDKEPNADDDIDSVIKQIFIDDVKEPQSYGNDALVDEKQPKEKDAVEFEAMEVNDTKIEENIQQKSINVDELTSAQRDDLMAQFAAAHKEDLDVNSESFAKHVAPVHVTLSVDTPTVITSPGYPSPYPTNNIIDWIFDGPGTGIELNITSFSVNGALGDYLLVKPGGIDESGKEGLIFSYRLTSERRYRFSEVNRMFVRFEAKPGFSFMTGFSFSVKLIWPLPTMGEEIPEPEPVIELPRETLTLNLAGLTLPQFSRIKREFTDLLADMAKVYIRDNEIDRGLNTTYEVTQITRTAVCNLHWPDYETCVEVTFGVPLQYEEETPPRLTADELNEMWTTYIVKEEFASRLRSLGITEYAIPNDRTVLMVWLVIAAGVVISMAMLAVALWRFSCFEDYTRMKAYSDTDSIKNEKRHLDLYPTPHQTLPPLYAESDYKWADNDSARVDMGGFANKSYIRDELFDLDSDEEVIASRDRKGGISPRELYEV